MNWKIHQDREEENPSIDSYTLTLNEKCGGWRTDSGYEGYGLPKEIAEWMCKVLNESKLECPYIMGKFGDWYKKKDYQNEL